jgi:hypothetical protein
VHIERRGADMKAAVPGDGCCRAERNEGETGEQKQPAWTEEQIESQGPPAIPVGAEVRRMLGAAIGMQRDWYFSHAQSRQ